MMGKTLEELNVKVGDVVAYSDGKEYTVAENKCLKANDGISSYYSRHWGDAPYFTLVTPTPPAWGEMTDEEKGALLLARHDGKRLQVYDNGAWISDPVSLHDKFAYRIKPSEPVVTTSTAWRMSGSGFIYDYKASDSATKGTRTITTLYGVCINDEWVADT